MSNNAVTANIPHDHEAEQAVLGAVIYNNDSLSDVASLLNPNSFYAVAHQHIFRAMLELADLGQPIDEILLGDQLRSLSQLEEAGGYPYLSELVECSPVSGNVPYYAKIVQEYGLLRELIATSTEIARKSRDPEQNITELLADAENKITEIATRTSSQNYRHIRDILVDSFERLERISNTTDEITGLPTGFIDLDKMTSGLQPSDLIILAARPSMGKCLSAEAEILLADGQVKTIEEIYHQQDADLLTLDKKWQFQLTKPSGFVDDGIKPVFQVTTKLGRQIKTTLTHPYLTLNGWKHLGELEPGDRIAVPRKLELFGKAKLPEQQVKLLAYLIGDGNLTNANPRFTNNDQKLRDDFTESLAYFPGLKVCLETSGGTRTPTLSVSKDLDWLQSQRSVFAKRLEETIRGKKISGRALAGELGVSPSLISGWIQGNLVPNAEDYVKLCSLLQVDSHELTNYDIKKLSKNSPNSLTLWLGKIGIWGKNAHEKSIPKSIFQLEKSLLSLFLNRLFATDGWVSVFASGQCQIGYASVSEKLAKQVQHLLLRFGVIAKLRERMVRYQGEYRTIWQIEVTDSHSMETFFREIGVFGKEDAIEKAQKQLKEKGYHTNTDLIPLEVWEILEKAKGEESWNSLVTRAGLKGTSNIHVGKRALSRGRLAALAKALNHSELLSIAESDVYWDKIVSIQFLGEQQVYDLTIPETHNFIANDICVHNTALALNIAQYVATKSDAKGAVLVFSLEMSKEQLAIRMLVSESKVDSSRIRSGNLEQEDWDKLAMATDTLSKATVYINDTTNLSPYELVTICKQLHKEYEHGVAMVMVDYLQLMKGNRPNQPREQEISEISRSMKGLAKELNVPVICLSQLNRALENRTDKRPQLSDLRESGAIEQDADIIMFIYRDEVYNEDSPDKGTAEILISKHRNGSTGMIRLAFIGKYTKFANYSEQSPYDD